MPNFVTAPSFMDPSRTLGTLVLEELLATVDRVRGEQGCATRITSPDSLIVHVINKIGCRFGDEAAFVSLMSHLGLPRHGP